MSYKDTIKTLDELFYEQAMLLEAKDNAETFEEFIVYETQLEQLDAEIEQLEATLKYN